MGSFKLRFYTRSLTYSGELFGVGSKCVGCEILAVNFSLPIPLYTHSVQKCMIQPLSVFFQVPQLLNEAGKPYYGEDYVFTPGKDEELLAGTAGSRAGRGSESFRVF